MNLFTRDGLIDPDSADLRPLTISDIEWQRLKKTSVDYVLCDREHDAPLVCIDFDGMQDGFNVGREYRTRVEDPSPWRDVITSLKLKVAHGSLFPISSWGTGSSRTSPLHRRWHHRRGPRQTGGH